MAEIWEMDGVALREAIGKKSVSAREVAEAHLARIETVNPKLNALADICPEETLAAADALDAHQHAGGPLAPLHGIPFSMKVTNQQKGWPTDCGVPLWRDTRAEEDSPLTGFIRAAGAVFIGRNTSPAFAMRFHTDSVVHGKTYNPWNKDISAGGSSGGAGSAIASGMQPMAQGNDIGGSIRWPAFCNGILGLRPTPGRIASINPASGAPRTNSGILMAVQGPMARTVRDLRLAFHVMAQDSKMDPLWVPAPLELERPDRPFRLGIVTDNVGNPGLHPAAISAVERAAQHLNAAGCVIEHVTLPGFADAGALWNMIGMSEVRMVLEPLLDQVADPGLSASVRGWWANMPEEVNLPRYLGALAERDRLIRAWMMAFQTYDAFITPVLAEPFLRAFSDVEGPEAMRHHIEAGRFLLLNALLGFPVLASRVGQHEGQPQGVQIIAPKWREDVCLALGELIEAAEGPIEVIDPKW